MLDDDRPVASLRPGNKSTDLDFYQITASQLAVDGEVEEGSIPHATFAIQKEADRPDLP